MRAFKKNTKRGFTLVELMIVVAIIGVLAALAIYGVTRYLASAKTSEAKNTIGALTRGAQEAYSREQAASELLAPTGALGASLNHDLCASSEWMLGLGPGAAPPGAKQQVDVAIFETIGAGNDKNTGWNCLRFSLTDPTYYDYAYIGNRDGGAPVGETVGTAAQPANLTTAIPAPGFGAYAVGDLDGDTNVSEFGLVGNVNRSTKSVNIATQVEVFNELE